MRDKESRRGRPRRSNARRRTSAGTRALAVTQTSTRTGSRYRRGSWPQHTAVPGDMPHLIGYGPARRPLDPLATAHHRLGRAPLRHRHRAGIRPPQPNRWGSDRHLHHRHHHRSRPRRRTPHRRTSPPGHRPFRSPGGLHGVPVGASRRSVAGVRPVPGTAVTVLAASELGRGTTAGFRRSRADRR